MKIKDVGVILLAVVQLPFVLRKLSTRVQGILDNLRCQSK